MKVIAVIALLCSALVATACGGGDSTEATESSTVAAGQGSTVARQEATPRKKPLGTDASEPIAGSPTPPKVQVPSGPPPTDLVVRDLKLGRGPVTRPHSRLAVYFVAVDYKTGKPFETHWDPQRPFVFEYNHGLPMQGWEEGLTGMKVGGRRKMLVPSHMAYKEGSIVYVVELLAVEKRPDFSKK